MVADLATTASNNKALCLVSANQRKKSATPYEWIVADQGMEAWETFVQRIETNKNLRGIKKRNYLLKNAIEVEEQFKSYNLNDIGYPYGERQGKGEKRRVFTRPGTLTAVLRRAWGLESLKKVDGRRLNDDRDHALNALVVAAVSEAEVQRLTRSFQKWEQ